MRTVDKHENGVTGNVISSSEQTNLDNEKKLLVNEL